MQKIKLLCASEIQKIAAGEVIDRPASVVKELLENALDAGACEIEIFIEDSGKKLIKISDNGFGMSPQDAKNSVILHATSKISSVDDLEKISSYGFRGEALATILAVSRLTIVTRESCANLGTKLVYEGLELKSEQNVPCKVGTEIFVQDLFYNVPARKKFLKQDETEFNQILQLFYAIALSHLNVSFKFFRDGRLFLNVPVVQLLKDRIAQLWDFNMSGQMLLLSSGENERGFSISGAISAHQYWRYNKNQIFLFVNGRNVKNMSLVKAVIKGYMNVLPKDKFPAAFIFIEIDPKIIDVNVHPRKEEIKFSSPVVIEQALMKAVTKALEINVIRPAIKMEQLDPVAKYFTYSALQKSLASSTHGTHEPHVLPVQRTILPAISTMVDEAPPELRPENIIGQLMKTYILIDGNNGLMMIDQHAAHERIIYEKLSSKFEKQSGTRLIFPEIIQLKIVELTRLIQHQEILLDLGIEIEQCGPEEIAIKTAPVIVKNISMQELIKSAADFVCENNMLERDVFRKKLTEHMHSQMACKGAIKAGDVLDFSQMRNLIDELKKVDNCFTCPHGRPTLWALGRNEIEKQFKRR